MNEQFKNFVNSIGILCETWMVVYTKFVQSGLDHKTALEHTKELISAVVSATAESNGGK